MAEYLYTLLTDPTLVAVALGTTLIAITAGTLGCFTLLQRKSLIGDGVAHSILPGVVLAYILTGHKDPEILFLGSVVAGWISLWAMEAVTRRSGLSADTAVGIVLSVFFGFGVMLLGWVQASASGNQSGLDKFLFGQAAAMTLEDVRFLSLVCLAVLAYVSFSFKEMRLRAFDQWYARSLGYDAPWLRYLENTVFVVVLTTGLQAVGVVLMSAVLILPAAIARYWTDRMPVMMVVAAAVAALAALAGSGISYMAPHMPTGPWMVVVAAVILFMSMALAPRYGQLSTWRRRRRQKQQIDEQHLLKTLWSLESASGGAWCSLLDLVRERPADAAGLEGTLKRLLHTGLVTKEEAYPASIAWGLTEAGREEARRLVRVHRLWETYLTELMQIADDHVHRDADWIEHIITPELEEQLAAKLGYPALDPHQQVIPYRAEVPR